MIRKKLIVLIPLKKSYPVNKRNIDERCSIFCLYLLTCFMHFFYPALPHFWQPSIFSNLFSASMSLVVTVVSKISYIKEINLVCLSLSNLFHLASCQVHPCCCRWQNFHPFFMAEWVFHYIPFPIYHIIFIHSFVDAYSF